MPLSAFDTVVHRAHNILWTIMRWAFVAWGVLNGFGTGLLGKVESVKRQISQRVPRVSGSFTR
jgi:hypothetical protein